MRILRKLGAYLRVLWRARRNRSDLFGFLVRRPALLAAVATYETAGLVSGRVEARLKGLGQIKVAAMTGCPF